jgi:hypothetical protein
MYSVGRWRRELRAVPKFAELVVDDATEEVGRLVVETPNGFRVAWDGAVDMKSLAQLVVELAR